MGGRACQLASRGTSPAPTARGARAGRTPAQNAAHAWVQHVLPVHHGLHACLPFHAGIHHVGGEHAHQTRLHGVSRKFERADKGNRGEDTKMTRARATRAPAVGQQRGSRGSRIEGSAPRICAGRDQALLGSASALQCSDIGAAAALDHPPGAGRPRPLRKRGTALKPRDEWGSERQQKKNGGERLAHPVGLAQLQEVSLRPLAHAIVCDSKRTKPPALLVMSLRCSTRAAGVIDTRLGRASPGADSATRASRTAAVPVVAVAAIAERRAAPGRPGGAWEASHRRKAPSRGALESRALLAERAGATPNRSGHRSPRRATARRVPGCHGQGPAAWRPRRCRGHGVCPARGRASGIRVSEQQRALFSVARSRTAWLEEHTGCRPAHGVVRARGDGSARGCGCTTDEGAARAASNLRLLACRGGERLAAPRCPSQPTRACF